MKHRKAIKLLHKYLYGNPSDEEKARVEKWYAAADGKRSQVERGDLNRIKEQLYQRIQTALQTESRTVPFYKHYIFKIAAAAAILLIIGVASWYLITKTQPANKKELAQKNDVVAPDNNKAVLVLANGTKILLDSASNGVMATEGKATVSKLSDGHIVYRSTGHDNIKYNTLTVPRGSKPVQLVLADGTEVWMNVASSMIYPVSFTGSERKVQINGEAWFNVAKNKAMPFKVIANGVETQALGTQFNIQAYNDEPVQHTTLLEGVVKVTGNNNSVIIKPGEQARLQQHCSSCMLTVIIADPDEVMAWKNGLFRFNNLEIKEIMRQIERWYDVQVEYEGVMKNEHFSGIVSRKSNVSEVLKIMEHAGLKFKIQSNKVTVIF